MHSQPGTPCTHAHPLLHTSHTSTSLLTICLRPFLPPYLSPACTSEVCINGCSMLSAGCLRGENNHHRIKWQSDFQAIPSFLQPFSAKQQLGGGLQNKVGGCGGNLSSPVPLENTSDPTQKQPSVWYKPVALRSPTRLH